MSTLRPGWNQTSEENGNIRLKSWIGLIPFQRKLSLRYLENSRQNTHGSLTFSKRGLRHKANIKEDGVISTSQEKQELSIKWPQRLKSWKHVFKFREDMTLFAHEGCDPISNLAHWFSFMHFQKVMDGSSTLGFS